MSGTFDFPELVHCAAEPMQAWSAGGTCKGATRLTAERQYGEQKKKFEHAVRDREEETQRCQERMLPPLLEPAPHAVLENRERLWEGEKA